MKTGGGTSYLAEAIGMSLETLPLYDRRQPRVVVIVSDGEWIDPEDRAAGLLAELREQKVAICHIGIGRPPHVADQADAAATVTDPLTTERAIGDAIVRAMELHLAR
ncbi:MAG: VWA domain-containing protein [Actinobacteria bacterium]|nr:VWA domain-containing protein [Actinomycetota bacterium]